MATAVITGISGQDGSFLAEVLVGEGATVIGLTRGSTNPGDFEHLAAIADRIELVHGDLADPEGLSRTLSELEADEIYHLAAPTFVPASWEDPTTTFADIAGGTAAVLRGAGDARVVVASSSEIFGDSEESPRRESSPTWPTSPYAAAKLAAFHLVRAYRKQTGVHASGAITFNHESERRPERFVTRKVTRAAAAIKLGLEDEVVLGDLGAVRDWSAARDVVRGLRAMAQQEAPDDYILASGRGRTVRELVQAAFGVVGLDPDRHVRVDPAFVRPPDKHPSVGDPAKARERLGWQPETAFDDLIRTMVEADLRRLGG